MWNSPIDSVLGQAKVGLSDVGWIISSSGTEFCEGWSGDIRCRFVSTDGMLEVVVVDSSAGIASNLPVVSAQTECPRREEEDVGANRFHQNLVANQLLAPEAGSCIRPGCSSIAG